MTYGYWKVDGVTVTTAQSDDVVTGYQPSSTIGRDASGWRAPRAADLVSSRLDGPLSGSADTTQVYTTGWGAVRGTRDALGNETWIDRQDATFPALPTRVRYPNGWQVTTAYTTGGLADTIIDRSTGAVTTYTWNTTFRTPTSVRSPEGIVTSYTHDAWGNVTTRVVGSAKDSIHYQGERLPDRVIDPMGRVAEINYDNNGNVEWTIGPDSVWTHIALDYRGFPEYVRRPSGQGGDSVMILTHRDVMGRDTAVVTTNSADDLRTIVRTVYSSAGDVIKVEPIGLDWTGSTWDTTRIGASEWVYDGLGRVTMTKTPVDTVQHIFEDGIVKSTSDGDTVTLKYDVLGRLRSRRTTARSFTTDTVQWGWVFPAFTSGLPTAAATDTFTYDGMGNLLTANNGFARIGHSYALNGALMTEVDTLRGYGGGQTFDSLAYLRSYAYNRDGQRVAIVHPTWINGGTDRTDYTYSDVTGRLSSVRDPLGNAYSFSYNAAGQPTVVTRPSAVDSLVYDGVGRLNSMKARVGGSLAYSFSPTYDNAGRVLQAGYLYNGLGHVTEYATGLVDESFSRDPFGTVNYHLIDLPDENEQPLGRAYSMQNLTGGRRGESLEVWAVQEHPAEPEGWQASYSYNGYDGRGNLAYTSSQSYAWEFSMDMDSAEEDSWARSYAQSYYAADGKLMVQQIDRDLLLFGVSDTTLSIRGACTRSTGTTRSDDGSSSGVARSHRSASTRTAAIARSSATSGTAARSSGSSGRPTRAM